jgi:ubiquitin-conjugating enzyme E2 N
MSRNSKIRIQKDFADLLTCLKKKQDLTYEEDPNCLLANLNDMTNFTILLKGPENTPYEGGKYRLQIKLLQDYPHDPPEIKMITKIYHPNIKEKDICLDILNNNWKPTYNLSKIFDSIYYLLKNPNTNDPLSAEVNSVYIRDYNEYIKNAQEWKLKYAIF